MITHLCTAPSSHCSLLPVPDRYRHNLMTRSHFRLYIRRRSWTAKGSQCYTDAGVFEADGQDALVDLVKLHQLKEVDEERQAVVHGEVLPAAVFALRRRDESHGQDEQ